MRMGSLRFLALVGELLVLAPAVTCALSFALAVISWEYRWG